MGSQWASLYFSPLELLARGQPPCGDGLQPRIPDYGYRGTKAIAGTNFISLASRVIRALKGGKVDVSRPRKVVRQTRLYSAILKLGYLTLTAVHSGGVETFTLLQFSALFKA